MLEIELVPSSSSSSGTAATSNSTLAFDTPSIESLDNVNRNRNANEIRSDKKTNFNHRLIQSSSDLSTGINHCSTSICGEHSSTQIHGANRIESALLTVDYSNLIGSRNRTGAGDENPSVFFHDKQVQTSVRTSEPVEYLPMEQVAIQNRRQTLLSSKQLVLLSLSVFLSVVFLCLTTTFFLI